VAISNLTQGSRPGICTSTTRPTAPYEGQLIYTTDLDTLEIWNGSAWKQLPIVSSSGSSTVMTVGVNGIQGQMPYALAVGSISASTNTSYQNTFYGTSAAVTFPTSRFSQAPIVASNVASGGYGWASCNSVSSTGISYFWLIADGNGASRTIHWHAIQMTSSASAG
jgi:hypothetical protein